MMTTINYATKILEELDRTINAIDEIEAEKFVDQIINVKQSFCCRCWPFWING